MISFALVASADPRPRSSRQCIIYRCPGHSMAHVFTRRCRRSKLPMGWGKRTAPGSRWTYFLRSSLVLCTQHILPCARVYWKHILAFQLYESHSIHCRASIHNNSVVRCHRNCESPSINIFDKVLMLYFLVDWN